MTDQNNNENQESVTTPGKLVEEARNKAGLSLAALAAKVNLRVSIIEDIEADVYDPGVSPTFSRGYLKLLAKTLGIDEQSLLDSYEKLKVPHKPAAELQSFSRRTAREASDYKLMAVSYGVAIVLIALAVVWWMQQDNSVQPVKVVMPKEEVVEQRPQPVQRQPEPAQAEPADTEEEPFNTEQVNSEIADSLNSSATTDTISEEPETSLDSTDTAIPAEIVELDEDGSQENSVQSEPSDAVIEETFPQEELQQASISNDSVAVGDENLTIEEPVLEAEDNPLAQESEKTLFTDADRVDLRLTFSRDCWIKVSDATGEDIAYGIKASGYIMPLTGVPPFEVTLCDPEFVAIEYQSTDIDMSQFANGRTAKFELPLVAEL